jgi:hypothetical protein
VQAEAALSYTIYIEFGAPSYAIVLLFGEMQIYVPLPVASPGAILGFLLGRFARLSLRITRARLPILPRCHIVAQNLQTV